MADQHSGSRHGQGSERQEDGRQDSSQDSSQDSEQDLKEREYRDENGNIHHHTREYLQAHPEDKGRPPRSKQGEGNGDGNRHR
jgi:hypothetical protein